MNELSSTIDLAEQHCQEKGKRLTKKRKLILLALLEAKKALSAYDLVEYCKQHLNEIIPVMSVYRILNFLQEHGLAHRLDLANKYIACSHIACEHQHRLSQFLICDQCQYVEEISVDSSALKNLNTAIEKNGFHISNPQLEINGICDNCFSHATTSNNNT